MSNNGSVIHTEERDINKMAMTDGSEWSDKGLEEQRALFAEQLLEQSERDKAIQAGLETMNLAEVKTEILRLRERQAKWIGRILEEAKIDGKSGSDLSTYIMARMNDPDEGQLDIKKRETILLNMLVHKTIEADREIHKETDRARQVALLIETYGLRLLTRARSFTKERVQYMESRNLIIKDERPLVDPKRKPQDLYMTEPTVSFLNNNPTLDLIHKLFEDIVEAIKAGSEELRPSRQEGEALVLPFGEIARGLVPRVKHPGDSIFSTGLYTDAYLKGANGEEDRVLDLDFRDGSLYPYKGATEPLLEVRNVGTSEKVYDLDHALLMAIYSECMTSGERIDGRYVIKLSKLMDKMGKSARGKNKKSILADIRRFGSTFAAVPTRPGLKDNYSYFSIFSSTYYQDTDLLMVSMDFFDLLNGTISKNYLESRKRRAGKALNGEIEEKIAKLEPGKPSREGHHSLAKMSLTSVRNKTAYYLVLSILDLISSAGVRVSRKSGESKSKREPVKRIHKTFQDLIEGNTVLQHRLSMAKSDNDRNTILSRTFKDAYEYLREHTRIYEYYKDLHIDEEKMIPSITDVKKGASFRCTHKGKIESPSEILPSDK